ncbi:uncharacterized protein LOC108674764 [Hyalella azteca]|uniref:Uncharacterized protein LOC108674764 n=1 Tax=Hyalella azteca TaxID=294128 RepID=A0A8B7NZD8_HYAAZ|nr:uncharacterized protein LOC108674764 [Hyalella azteca]
MAANFKQLVAVKDVVQPWLSFVKDRTFQHSAQPLHVVTDSSARMFSGVLPFDMPSQPPVRRLDLNEDRRIPVDDEHDTHLKEKIKKHDQEEEIKSLGKSIGSVLDSNNDLSQLTLEPEISEDDNRFEEIPFDENFDEVQLKNANNTQAVTKGSNIIESLRNSSTAVETESSLTVHGAIHEATAWVYGLPAADSGYLQQTAVSITQYTHWHLPALLTAIQFFTQLEVTNGL